MENSEKKYCKGCEQMLDRKHFSKNRKAKDGLHRICKDCQSEVYYEKQTSGYK